MRQATSSLQHFISAKRFLARGDAIEWEELPSLANSLAERLVNDPVRRRHATQFDGAPVSAWDNTMPADLATGIPDGWGGLDAGPKSIELYRQAILSSKTIIWNGPPGVFEFDAFAKGTEVLAHAIADSKAFSIAGGGDTLAAVDKFGIENNISYISTGGGAFLEFCEGKPLPAVTALLARGA